MVNELKVKTVEDVGKEIEKHSVVGILNLYKLPARDLMNIKQKLKGKAKVRVVKRRLIKIALEKSKKDLKGLIPLMTGQPALLLSNSNPFELAAVMQKSKSKAFANAGDVAPEDIVVPAGPTSLPAGPAIGELQRAKITAAVENGKIVVKKDSVVAKKGDVLSAEVAGVMTKLGIQPMEIGLDLVAAWDQGLIYNKDILFVPAEKYLDDLKLAYTEGLNLSVKINYYTEDNIKIFLSKGYSEAQALAVKVGYLTKETVGPILAKAQAEATALEKALNK